MDGLIIKNGNLKIKKNQEIKIESDFKTEIKIDEKNITNYLTIFKNNEFINQNTSLSGKLENFLDIAFDKRFRITNYIVK